MRLLLDETLGRSVATVLRDRGHDVVRSSEAGGPGLSDEELLETATSEGRVLVTLDEGFANAVRFDPSGTPGIVVISLPDDQPISAGAGAAIDRLQGAVVDTRRAALDLATERHRLDSENARLVEATANLRFAAADARAEGRDEDLRSILERLAMTKTEIDRLRARRVRVVAQEKDTRTSAEELASRVQAARTQFELDRAELLVVATDDGRRTHGGGVEDGAGAAQAADPAVQLRLAEIAAEDRVFEQLAAVWGSLARDLARAWSHLLSALDSSDPRGRLWVAGVDGVKQYRDSA